jgi:hypothetical protein
MVLRVNLIWLAIKNAYRFILVEVGGRRNTLVWGGSVKGRKKSCCRLPFRYVIPIPFIVN